VIGADKLYLLTPGASRFVAFTNSDGLHVQPFTDPAGNPAVTSLTAVAGGQKNEVYLGYFGYENSPDPFSDTEAQKELGNGDRIELDPHAGEITVTRYQFRCVAMHATCWEDRSVRNIIFARTGTASGHAFFGFNHGATNVFHDVLGDHVHPEIGWIQADGSPYIKYGESQSIAVNDDGTVWVGNRYGVGLMNAEADPIAWVSAKFKIAFTTYTDDHAIDVPWGYTEGNRAASVTSDGTVWLASERGLSSYDPKEATDTIKHWTDVPHLMDISTDDDDTLWAVTMNSHLLHIAPTTGNVVDEGLTDAQRIFIDLAVSPRVLYVARDSGLTAFTR
jgi:hypothetical protein